MSLRDIRKLVQGPRGRQGLNYAENLVSRFSHQGFVQWVTLGSFLPRDSFSGCFWNVTLTISGYPRKPASLSTSTPATLGDHYCCSWPAVSYIFSSSPLTFRGTSKGLR